MGKKPAAVDTAIEKCCVGTCKHKSERFGFCNTHYDHFKFGLVKKDGTQVPDYEKKFDHYQSYLSQTARKKVA